MKSGTRETQRCEEQKACALRLREQREESNHDRVAHTDDDVVGITTRKQCDAIHSAKQNK